MRALFVCRVHICTVAASDEDGQEAGQGEEKVWSLVQLIKESRKSPKTLGGQVCPQSIHYMDHGAAEAHSVVAWFRLAGTH